MGASRVRTADSLILMGKIRRSDWLPVGGNDEVEQTRRGRSSESTISDSFQGSEDQGASDSLCERESTQDENDDSSESCEVDEGADSSDNATDDDVDEGASDDEEIFDIDWDKRADDFADNHDKASKRKITLAMVREASHFPQAIIDYSKELHQERNVRGPFRQLRFVPHK